MSCCSHLFEIGDDVTPKTPNGCEECLKMGDRWVHLRLCVTCGHVGCCDDSKNKFRLRQLEGQHETLRYYEVRPKYLLQHYPAQMTGFSLRSSASPVSVWTRKRSLRLRRSM
jgi:hypothetical protein